MPLPTHRPQFERRSESFRAWLLAHGSEIRASSNEWELLRFTTPQGVGVVYTDAKGQLSWTGGADATYNGFATGTNGWRMTPPRPPAPRAKSAAYKHRVRSLVQRDGDECWFCGGSFVPGDAKLRRSLEHFVAVIHGGPDHLSNLGLAHADCNAKADHLSVAEKVRLREKMRGAK